MNEAISRVLFCAIENDAEQIALDGLLGMNPDPNYEGIYGEPLLFAAIRKRRFEAVSKLLQLGAKTKTKHNGKLPLHAAAENPDCAAAIELLLLHDGVDVDGKTDRRKMTPLMLAAENGHQVNAAKLIECGADVGAVSENGLSPLAYAALNGSASCMSVIIDAGASVVTALTQLAKLVDKEKRV